MDTHLIETLDNKRRKFLFGHIVGFVIFFTGWFIRLNLKIFHLELFLIELIGFVIFIIGFIIQAFYAIKSRILDVRIKRDPVLHNAIYNELYQHYRKKAWFVAFVSLISFLTVVLVLDFILKIGDTAIMVITALMVGSGAYNIAFYSLDNS